MDSEALAAQLYVEDSERHARLGRALQVAYDALVATVADALAGEVTEAEADEAGLADTADALFRDWYTKGWA
jgi:hypothetical protein